MSNLRTGKKRDSKEVLVILKCIRSPAHGGVVYHFVGNTETWKPVQRRLRRLAKKKKFVSKPLLGNMDAAAERLIRRLTLRRLAKLTGKVFGVRHVYEDIRQKLGPHVRLRVLSCIEKLFRRFALR